MTRGARLVLASRSAVRIKLLEDAGIALDIDPADVDEDAIGAPVSDPAARALALATAKGRAVSARHPGRLVLGGDQVGVLVKDDGSCGAFLEKPRDPAHHVRLLLQMAGRTHRFHPAAVLVVDGDVRERVADTVAVTFRAFDERTARAYVATGEGQGSCGGYESEHRGAQLIERIDGAAHAVLGLPLLGVLAALRRVAPAGMLLV